MLRSHKSINGQLSLKRTHEETLPATETEQTSMFLQQTSIIYTVSKTAFECECYFIKAIFLVDAERKCKSTSRRIYKM